MPATQIVMETSQGTIKLELDGDKAPISTANFLSYVDEKFYDGTVFHRVIPGFVVQGGDGEFGRQDEKGQIRNAGRVGTGGPGYKFEDEPFTGDYDRGAFAMANGGPNTNGSQFFICHQDLRGKLPRNYTRFGQVLTGMDVVDAIAAAPRNSRDFPESPVAMISVTIEEA